MARATSAFIPIYIADYLADTTHLTTVQHGAFLLLLFSYWRRGSKLPDSDIFLAQVARLSVKEWLLNREVLAQLFHVENGWWSNKRLEEELKKAADNYTAKSEAGAKGAARRWQKDSTAIAQPSASQYQTDTPSPSHSPIGEIGGAEAPAKSKSKRGVTIPPDWKPSEADAKHATDRGVDPSRIPAIAEHFRDHHAAKGTVTKDISASWRTWIANELRFNGKSAPAPTAAPKVRTDDEWTAVITQFLATGNWPATGYGREPGLSGCIVPTHLITTFNLDGMTPPGHCNRMAS